MKSIKDVPVESGTKISQKIIIAIIVVFVFFAGLIAFLGRYYGSVGQAQNLGGNPLQRQIVSLVEVEKRYKDSFSGIIGGYLANDDLLSDDFLQATRNARRQLLDLSVPPAYKDLHLSAVVALGEIEQAVLNDDSASASQKMDNLKEIFADF